MENEQAVLKNIEDGRLAMQKVIKTHKNVRSAMYRDDVGYIDFVWGTAGQGGKFKRGYGVSHIIAKRDSESGNGEETALFLPEVIAKGTVISRNAMSDTTQPRVLVGWQGFTALLSFGAGKKNAWLLSGWMNHGTKKETTIANGEGDGSTAATAATPMRSRRDGEDVSLC